MSLDLITNLFCHVDDFCRLFEPLWNQVLLKSGAKSRNRRRSMALSEIMTVLILFHKACFRNFKNFYKSLLWHHRGDFPGLPSYNRFVAWIPSTLVPLEAYWQTRKGRPTGIAFIDSTPLRVCHTLRIARHKVFQGLARRGKTSTGWFFGFKLHFVVNDVGELLSFQLTPGHTSDREPLEALTKGLFGKLFGDKGYLDSKKTRTLLQRGLHLITGIRNNMKNRLMPLIDKILLKKRFVIETITDQLKNISQIEHSRHRSVCNFAANLLSGLIAYTHQEKKPSIYTDHFSSLALPPAA